MTLSKYLKPNDIITTVIQLSLPIGLYLGIISNSDWYWWVLSIFFYTIVYTMIGNNIGYHRYFTHKHFEVAKPYRWLFLWAGSVSGIGDPIAYATTHLVHHKYSDTEQDPHGPVRGWRSVMFCFYKRVNPKDTPIVGRRVVELLRSYGWAHNYYLLIILANAGIMYAIDYRVFLFCWLIPASLFLWGLGIAVLLQHWGLQPRNFKSDKWIPHYEGLHYNHHSAPAAPDTALNSGEIDWTYKFSLIFKPEYYWQGQPGYQQDAQHTNA